MKRILLLLVAFGIAGCDTEGEIIQGRTLSSVAPHSGAAGGNSPVIGGVYYDSVDGLTISHPGNEGDVLVLSADMEPVWTNASAVGLPFRASATQQNGIAMNAIKDLTEKNQRLEKKLSELEARLEKLLKNQQVQIENE